MKHRIADLETERAELTQSDPVDLEGKVEDLLHPNLPELYRSKVQELESLLDNDPDGDEAKDLIRSMTEKVILSPRKSGKGLDVVLFGDLATILEVCSTIASGGQNSEDHKRTLSGCGGAKPPRVDSLMPGMSSGFMPIGSEIGDGSFTPESGIVKIAI